MQNSGYAQVAEDESPAEQADDISSPSATPSDTAVPTPLKWHHTTINGPDPALPKLSDELDCSYPDCTYRATNRSNLGKHIGRHRREFKCPFEDCLQSIRGFGTIYELNRHQKIVHRVDPEGFISYRCFGNGCKEPEKDWLKLPHFREHVMQEHPDESVEDLLKQYHDRYRQLQQGGAVPQSPLPAPGSNTARPRSPTGKRPRPREFIGGTPSESSNAKMSRLVLLAELAGELDAYHVNSTTEGVTSTRSPKPVYSRFSDFTMSELVEQQQPEANQFMDSFFADLAAHAGGGHRSAIGGPS